MEESELSFSDVTSLVYEILHRLDDSEFLYFRLDAVIEHILLDEFQDTSIVQYEILKPLIQEITSGQGVFSDASFFFVGDVKQSIYRFRGGVSALFGAVVKENATEVEQLVTNYRSQKELIAFVNSVFEKKIKNYTPQLVRDEAQGGSVEIIENNELLQESLEQVKKLIKEGAKLDDIAILCATNGDGEEIKNQLQLENIEVVTETTTKLINQKSVQAVLEYLKYLYFGEDIYKYNFFSLINQKVGILRQVDLNAVKLVDIIKRVIDAFKLFRDDFHLIRFINAVSKYSDIESLLFEYERLDTAAAASDISGVRVLTVHKSKGLEYEHVIVMDRLRRAPSPRNAIIYKYDEITLQNIYLRTKGRETLDASYERALVKEKELTHEDSLNALYVAFTRARENLIIVKKSKDSSFEILELHSASFGELRCRKTEEKHEEKASNILEYTPFYYGTQKEILALEKEKNEDLNAINFGLAMHYMLEMIAAFDEDKLNTAKDMMINKYGYSLEDEAIDDIANRINKLITNKEFISLSEGICYKEKALRYKNNLRYLDLLVKRNDGSWSILDYKSSFAYSEEHLKQVSYYVHAVKEITGDRVDGYLCYLLKNEVKIVRV
jgi:exodeoxyribonuclease V beta subunit